MGEARGKVEGSWTIETEVELYGMAAGDGVVARGGNLVLRRTCCESLWIADGGRAAVHGMVAGDVVNEGVVHISGTIVGRLDDRARGAIVMGGALINGVRYP